MLRKPSGWIVLHSALAVATAVGCGGSDDAAVVVVGNVTYAGAPVEVGEVKFAPTDIARSGTFTAPIESGQYAFRGDKALLPGPYRIEVRGFRNQDGSTTGINFSDPEASFVQYLPNKYNRTSQLALTIEPGASDEVRHDLELEK